MSIVNKYSNVDNVIKNLLDNLFIYVSQNEISEELEMHPDYPSLLAVSDVLTNFNITNAAYSVDYDSLLKISTPFIAHTNLNGDDFVVVNKISKDSVFVSNQNLNKHRLSFDEFKDLYEGFILKPDSPLPAGMVKSKKSIVTNIKNSVLVPYILLLLLLILVFYPHSLKDVNGSTILLTILKLGGLVTSILLIVQSIDSNNPLIQKICKSGIKSDCQAVLSSSAAKIFEWLTWSDVGFFYFAGTFLFLLFNNDSSTATWQLLAFLNFISLPYTFYSIYYQAFVARQWCTLCCTVQLLLWLEFTVLVSKLHFFYFTHINSIELRNFFICLLLPAILWMLLKPLLLKLQQIRPLKQQLRNFKYNTELFNKILTEQSKYAQPDSDWSIVLGNLDAKNIITIISNPFCQPCSIAHNLLNELMTYNNDIQARFVFAIDNTDNDIKTKVSKHLLAINNQSAKEVTKNALDSWYKQTKKNYTLWSNSFPSLLDGREDSILNKQSAWCQMAEITSTPTILLNGYRLPDLYNLGDLKYMI